MLLLFYYIYIYSVLYCELCFLHFRKCSSQSQYCDGKLTCNGTEIVSDKSRLEECLIFGDLVENKHLKLRERDAQKANQQVVTLISGDTFSQYFKCLFCFLFFFIILSLLSALNTFKQKSLLGGKKILMFILKIFLEELHCII